jgi:hypothetical protein
VAETIRPRYLTRRVKSFPYARPVLLAENLWEIRGEWSNALGRRMTVVRLRDGDVFVHAAIRLDPHDLGWLHGLGPVRGIIAPNRFHCSDAPWLAQACPQATVYAPGARADLRAGLGTRLYPLEAFPGELAAELECVPMRGTRIGEAAFLHHPSRTLILCDLAMNMEAVFTGWTRLFMRWNRVGGRFGITRLTKLLFASDARALHRSYRELLERDFDRVIVSHGAVLETGGREQLRASVAQTFGAG